MATASSGHLYFVGSGQRLLGIMIYLEDDSLAHLPASHPLVYAVALAFDP